MQISEKVRKLRENLGMTQLELAKMTGISVRMIQRYEAGSYKPSFDALNKLAPALHTNVETLSSEDENVSEARDDLMKHVQALSALLAGGKIPDEDRAEAMRIIIEALTKTSQK